MVEWSKTWDLSCANFPITQVARVRTPLLSSFFFSFRAHCVPENVCYICDYIESRCEKGSGISKYKIKQGRGHEEESKRIVTSPADSSSPPSTEFVREKPASD